MQTDDEEEEVDRSEDGDRQGAAEQSRAEQSAGPAGRHRHAVANVIREEEKAQEGQMQLGGEGRRSLFDVAGDTQRIE